MSRAERIQGLLGALQAPEPGTRREAVAELRALGVEALPALVRGLEDEGLTSGAAVALEAIGDPAAREPLRAALARARERWDYGAYLGRHALARALLALGDRSPATLQALEEVVDRDFGPEVQRSWGALRDEAVDLLVEARGVQADAFLRPFLGRERETLQLRYRIARRYWLAGERGPQVRGVLERMARHPLYPSLSAEARDLLAVAH